jgi:ceramide glucosyltransferase
MLLQHSLAIAGLIGLALATVQIVLTFVAVVVWRLLSLSAPVPRLPASEAVTVLKPLCGAEPGLYQQLRSFCEQDFPQFQIVFGVSDPADAALSVVHRLIEEFPSLCIDLVINPTQHGSNCKTSNLINMMAQARHDLLLIADSDTLVQSDYVRTVTAPLQDRAVGLVTSTYRDVPTPLLWSRVGAMYTNEWYMPSALLTWLFGYTGYASGQTLCLRRTTLDAIGGFEATASHLADDYRLGELIRGIGLRIVLSPAKVVTEHHEPNLDSLVRHEMRWMRTIRVLRPRSYNMMFLSFSLPVASVGLLCAAWLPSLSVVSWSLFGIVALTRMGLYLAHRLGRARPVWSDIWSDIWLLPVHDLLLCWVWLRTFFASRLTWRGREFDVDVDGVIRQES